ncbi:Coadhesin [Lamellibrachia satsuma]|nr:Coadhesin [Lamellibrachia satsuma]
MAVKVDGEWLEWSEWTVCSHSCDTGQSNRTRYCRQPEHGGRTCNGSDTDTRPCNTRPCPVDGEWAQWSEWTVCSRSCDTGQSNRTRFCYHPKHGGISCNGSDAETRACNAHPCPVDAKWMDWAEWSACNRTCGGGWQSRVRACLDPQYGGQPCNGPHLDTQLCNTRQCPVDGRWTSWTEWTQCNVTCGGGRQQRTRHCEAPQYGGQRCRGFPKQTRQCNSKHCPVDGVWEEWQTWGTCSHSCGSGRKTRTRECTSPKYDGQPCEGPKEEYSYCFTEPCPIDGEWDPWSEWSECPVTCGGSTRMRTRLCQKPLYGGSPCRGDDEGYKPCALVTCFKPRPWLLWSSWSTCSVTCGGGVRTRTRRCDDSDLGSWYAVTCEGVAAETTQCHDYPCRPALRTCDHWKRAGLEDNAWVKVDPTTKGSAFWVHCNIRGAGETGITEVWHDHMPRTEVGGFEERGSYHIELKYNITDAQLRSLIAVSRSCRQWLRWECKSAGIKSAYDTDVAITYWYNADGDPRYYWPGADPSSDMCACGMTGTCAMGAKKCNCDANDDVWREDSGYLTYKHDLPVTSFKAGDTGSTSEQGAHTIGKLECIE